MYDESAGDQSIIGDGRADVDAVDPNEAEEEDVVEEGEVVETVLASVPDEELEEEEDDADAVVEPAWQPDSYQHSCWPYTTIAITAAVSVNSNRVRATLHGREWVAFSGS